MVERISMKMAKTGHFYSVQHPYAYVSESTPRSRSPCLGVDLRKGGGSFASTNLRQGFFIFLVRLGVEKLRLNVPTNFVFSFSFPLSLTIAHWINGDPNK